MGVVVTLGEERNKTGRTALDGLLDLVHDEFLQVDQEIRAYMVSDVPLIPELANHIIASGGKRLRPVLLLAAARLCGHTGGGRAVKLAACVEFIHTATLLHDDVVDGSALRRGKKTANIVWGNQASVLVGDFMFTRAFQIMTEDGSLPVLEILSRASSIIAEGEVMQLTTANNLATTEDAYLKVIAAKTAALFAASTHVGAVIADRPKADQEALESYGRNLGIAFQLVDDALDYAADESTLGKTVGDDFREGKITLPVVLAYRRGTDDERRFWQRCMEAGEQGDDDLARALVLMDRHGALRDTVARARHYGDMARDALGTFPDGPERQALMGVVDFCVERAY